MSLAAEKLGADALAPFRAMLREAGLPDDDLGDTGRDFFCYRDNGEICGYGGFELYGDDALLRSIIVTPPLRRTGIGGALVNTLLADLRSQGIRSVYLVTNTAAKFFERAGFTEIERRFAPPSIRGTRQLKDLCPASASLMHLELR